MQQHDWDRVQELFLSAADLAPGERQRFLDEFCAPGLREEVESLLAADRKRGEGITTAVEKGAAAILDAQALVGERLGAYRVLRQIGRGGMGAVYLATRDDEQYRKEVAIKVVKRGMDTEEVLARFRYERQILANLDHPYIASLHDSGTTPDGRPFFVMEYVQGQAVDAFCKESGLDLKQRCRLFLKICEAVAHAHRNLVIHRDLKPANIFVTPQGNPKLLDFGIAKLLGESAGAGNTTIASSRPITPEYASPEQISGHAVTTATDIYSLGAVLYELLSGKRAHQIETTTSQQIQRTVFEKEMVRASEFTPDLDPDLGNIILMAMRKEPERRYISVDQFAGDVRCYLESRPVLARKDSLSYRLRKFAVRHRYALGAGFTIFAGIISLSAIALYQAHQARAARQSAELNRDTAIVERQRAEEQLAQIVDVSNRSLLGVYAAMERLPGATSARKELINTTLDSLEKLSAKAGNNRQLKLALARAYSRLGDLQGDPDSPNIGDMTGALKSYHTASALLGNDPPVSDTEPMIAWTEIQNKIGKVLTDMGSRSGAAQTLENAIRICEANPAKICGNATRLRATLYLSLSRATIDLPLSLDRAREALRSATAAAEKAPDDVEIKALLSTAETQFGFVHALLGDPESAEAPYLRSVRIREQLARDHPNDIFLRRLLKLAYEHLASLEGDSSRLNLGRPDLARLYYQKARPLEEADAADPQNLLAKFDYALFLLAAANVEVPEDQLAASVANMRKAVAIFESLAVAQPMSERYRRSLAEAHAAIGSRYRQMKRYSEAIDEYRQARSLQLALLAQDPDLAILQREFFDTERGLALTWMSAGDATAAFEHIRQTLRTAGSLHGPEKPLQVAETDLALAAVHKQVGECPQARSAAGHAVAQVQPLLTAAKRDRYRDLLQRAEALIGECNSPR